MKSGDPAPSDDLRLVMASKRGASSLTVEVVSDASRWLKAALKGGDVPFTYSTCEQEDHYGFSSFVILRKYKGQQTKLELKIAELRSLPFAFADVHPLGNSSSGLFPFFGNLDSDENREILLHYIADFVMSTTA